MSYKPMTRTLYKRLCEALYRLEPRRSRYPGLRMKLGIAKALFDDHGTFHEVKL